LLVVVDRKQLEAEHCVLRPQLDRNPTSETVDDVKVHVTHPICVRYDVMDVRGGGSRADLMREKREDGARSVSSVGPGVVGQLVEGGYILTHWQNGGVVPGKPLAAIVRTAEQDGCGQDRHNA
jgi:hypothetical protein